MISNYRKTRGIIERGTRALQPPAGDVLNGTLYFVTDEGVTERSNGLIWQLYSASPSLSPSSALQSYRGLDGIDGENTEIILLGSPSGNPVIPGGSNTQVQFNDSGIFGGDAGLVYDKATDALTINGDMIFGANKVIRRNTVDGSDNGTLFITAAGAAGANRGGYMYFEGNEGGAYPGGFLIQLGDVSGAQLQVYKGNGGFAFVIDGGTGKVGIGTATVPSLLTVDGLINLKNYTVATLPAATRGDIAYVTDALAPSFLAVLVGGGAVVTPCFYNGVNWVGF